MDGSLAPPGEEDRRKRITRTIVIVNTVLCVVAIAPAFAIQVGVILGAAAAGATEQGRTIGLLGVILPAVPILSVVGSWATLGWRRVALAFVALPWAYALLLLGVVVLFLRT